MSRLFYGLFLCGWYNSREVIFMSGGYEIERKFLIEYPDIKLLSGKYEVESTEIVQTYLGGDSSTRVRKRGSDGCYAYTLTVKKSITDVVRTENEKTISEEEYNSLIAEYAGNSHTVEKIRCCFPFENQLIEIDLYPFWNDKAILEIELPSVDSPYYIPKEISVIREVTSEARYRNAVISKTPMEELKEYD